MTPHYTWRKTIPALHIEYILCSSPFIYLEICHNMQFTKDDVENLEVNILEGVIEMVGMEGG